MYSLNRRLLVSVSVPLVVFFGITIATLDASFRSVSDRGLRDLIDAQMVALLAAAELQPSGTVAPSRALDPRLSIPGSGLYAQIREADAAVAESERVWRSASTAGAFIDFGAPVAAGQTRFGYGTLGDGTRVAIASRAISFEDVPGDARALTFSVATSLKPYERQLLTFRTEIFGWFIVLTLALLAILAVLLRWVLAPARRLEREITEVEAGARESLGAGYPRELSGVVTNLNALLSAERRRVVRYRDTLGNLAHSLKTPLAVMRAALAGGARASTSDTLNTEIDRMTGIIGHQLKRAAAAGGAMLGQGAVEVAPIASDLRTALLKVHASKDLSLELAVAANALFVGDRADLTELLGNLLDNACKWCRRRVRLAAASDAGAPARQRLRILVEDDGEGIDAASRERVLERGVRDDEQVAGHGLGLAMVRDTVELYGGTLAIERSDLGGARIAVSLPGR